jgi:DNA-binding transcriptional regulator YdaS (Cro superfamily)
MSNATAIAALHRALDWFGNHGAMAHALRISSRVLQHARYHGRVSREIAERIHKLTAGRVRREELRPDLYPRHRTERKRRATKKGRLHE